MTINGVALIFALSMFVAIGLVYGVVYGDWIPAAAVGTFYVCFALFYWGFLCILVGIRDIQDAIAKYRAARHAR